VKRGFLFGFGSSLIVGVIGAAAAMHRKRGKGRKIKRCIDHPHILMWL
jgi:hypothetical protein